MATRIPSITISYNERRFDMSCSVVVSSGGRSKRVKAVWDTGSHSSAVSRRVIEFLGLKPNGVVTISSLDGVSTRKTYSAVVVIEDKIRIEVSDLYESDTDRDGIDVLIGMNIICLGSFAITNYNGNTVLSFHIPSDRVIDFTKEP